MEELGKLFKISGSFEANGGWQQPDPCFTGEISVREDNSFVGYSDELYDWPAYLAEGGKRRYLTGYLANNDRNGKLGISFFKLSNYHDIDAYLYVTPELDDPESGSYAAPTPAGYFRRQGKTRIYLEEEPYDEQKKTEIEAKFRDVDLRLRINYELVSQISSCKKLIETSK